MAGTIFVDTDNLPGVTASISNIQSAIDGYKTTINGLSAQLDLYLSGTAPVIKQVEDAFAATLTTLISADSSLSALATQLTNVQQDALAAINAL